MRAQVGIHEVTFELFDRVVLRGRPSGSVGAWSVNSDQLRPTSRRELPMPVGSSLQPDRVAIGDVRDAHQSALPRERLLDRKLDGGLPCELRAVTEPDWPVGGPLPQTRQARRTELRGP